MAISDRVESALQNYWNHNYESALLELSSAVDATASRKHPKEKVGVRFREFIHEYREFLYFGAMGWGVRFIVGQGDLQLDVVDNTLAKILYKRARNPVVHEGQLDGLEVMEDHGIKIAGPTLGLGRGFILATILAVVGDPANHREKFKGSPVISIGEINLSIGDFWGRFTEVQAQLHAQAATLKPIAE